MNESQLPDRLKASASGLGEASQTEIDHRAAELARMDGRDRFTDADLVQAAEELGAQSAGAEARTWEDSAQDAGRRTARGALENDSSLGEQLIQQGMDDADHDRRVASSEESEL